MEAIERLEAGVAKILSRMRNLEEENRRLRSELQDVKRTRDTVLERVDRLLEKVQGELS
jgi:chromosome segregation ATPase